MLREVVENVVSDESYTNCIIPAYSYNSNMQVVEGSGFNKCVIEGNLIYKNCVFTKCVFTDYIYDNEYLECSFNNCIFSPEQNLDKVNDPYTNLLCEGDIIGYKKTFVKDVDYYETVIVKLLIPAKAKRLNGYSNKCRAEYAKVLEIYDANGKISKYRTGQSSYHNDVYYVKNRIVRPDSFDESREVCSNGIHFFRTFKEAADYNL